MTKLAVFGLRSRPKRTQQGFQQPADARADPRHLWATDGHIGLEND
ncbi:MAG: hypothetical protein IPK17_30425 [Chloroflexi bacterium]|nr:hypothetical protein [Chloroflexota bacterium]